LVLILGGCTTSYLELKGECVIQQWSFIGQTMRKRLICDLPPPTLLEEQVRDREAMNTNPFPNLIDLDNNADSMDPNLLEKEMNYPQEAEE